MDEASGKDPGSIRVLAIASGGGHWTQLLRLRSAWDGLSIAYASTHADYAQDFLSGNKAGNQPRYYSFPDANRQQKLRLVLQLIKVIFIVLKERPHVVISTGASAGYFALRIGKLLRSKTVWVDSIANADELSLAGERVAPYADLWLTQWPHLAANGASMNEQKPKYCGSVL